MTRGFPLWWAGAYVPSYPYGYADPSGEVPYAYPLMENFSERSRPVVTYQPGMPNRQPNGPVGKRR